MTLDDDVRRLATSTALATVVTQMPDGSFQALPLWVDCDESHILINTEPQRQRAKNLERNPAMTVLIVSKESDWDWVEVRGVVTESVSGQAARDHIDALSRRYLGVDYPNQVGPQGRIIYKLSPTKVNSPRRMGR
ncbi:MAG: TIGR03618 family F420-dependent PPOX class oxidoreductase [Tetrasphaera sp.]|nr:TIGR03618 family F420-dependent PPOX class oxidoreductase [Tetrasphaera sp.]